MIHLRPKANYATFLLKTLQWLPISFRTKAKVLTMVYKVFHNLPPISFPRPHYFFDINFIFLSLTHCFSHTGHLAISLYRNMPGCSCLRTFVVLFSWPGMRLYLIPAWPSPIPPSGPCSNATFSLRLLWPFYLKLTFFFTLFYPTALHTI